MLKNKTCSVDGCEKDFYCKLLCNMHYLRKVRTGEVGEAEPRHKIHRNLEIDWNDRDQVRKYYREVHATGYYKNRREEGRKTDPDFEKTIKSMHNKRFGGLREAVLERDNYCCQHCGMTDEEHREKWDCQVSLHHIDGQGSHSETKNHTMENLLTLCKSCHSIEDWKRIKKARRCIDK